MASRDIFQSLNDQDEATLERVVARMEHRARDSRFVKMRGAYLDRLELASARTFLDLGCGTGLDARAAAQRPEFKGVATGVDVSTGMIVAGEELAEAEGVASRVFLRVADAAATGLPSGSFDVVVMHTLMSHVADPAAVLREAGRLLGSRGRVLVFDADFASISIGYGDEDVAKAMEEALLATMVANPRILRQLPLLARECRLQVVEVESHILADIGGTNYFEGFIENYAPLVVQNGLQPAGVVEAWQTEQRRRIQDGTFFGTMNYHAYLLRPIS